MFTYSFYNSWTDSVAGITIFGVRFFISRTGYLDCQTTKRDFDGGIYVEIGLSILGFDFELEFDSKGR